jgi:hypothetical protein
MLRKGTNWLPKKSSEKQLGVTRILEGENKTWWRQSSSRSEQALDQSSKIVELPSRDSGQILHWRGLHYRNEFQNRTIFGEAARNLFKNYKTISNSNKNFNH